MGGVREAMIVAGGAGTRLRPLTLTTPKPLLPFCGPPLLTGMIGRLAAVGVERVLLVVGAEVSPFAALRDDAAALGVTLETVPEPEPLDTAGGVRSALQRVTGTFLVCNGDILTDLDLGALVASHRRAGAAATLALSRLEDPRSFGVCVLEGSRIAGFVEKPAPGELPGQDTINAGTYVLEPEALAGFTPGRLSFERQVFPELVAAGAHVEGVVGEGVWADLGTPGRYRAGHRLALDGALDWPSLRAWPADADGVRLAGDAQVASGVELRGPVLALPGARVEAGAVLGPHVVLGAGAHLGTGVELADSVLHDRVGIGPGVRAHGLVAGHGSSIGRQARLGADVVLGAGFQVPAHAAIDAGARLGEGEQP